MSNDTPGQTKGEPQPIIGADAMQVLVGYVQDRAKRERNEHRWRLCKRTFYVAAILTVVLGYLAIIGRATGQGADPDPTTATVAVVAISGEIASGARASADNLVPLIQKACLASKVKIVVLDIDSPGGAPSEAERIVAAVDRCHGSNGKAKPVYALIDGLGASAAYMIAMHTDKVIAGRYSLVGSVGAIMRYFDASAAVNRFGLAEKVFRSGPLKGGPSMFSPTSPADAAINTELVHTIGQGFVDEVVKSRGAKLKVTPEELASGRIWTSGDALRLGLIDEQGVLEDLEAGEFKGLQIQRYKPRPSVAKLLGLEDAVHNVVLDLVQPQIR